MLANRPVQPQKTGRLGNRFREQARSHKICVQRQALQRGAHVVINYAGVHPRSASALWERACSRIGQCSHREQGVWAIAFASKLAPTKSVYNAKCFSVGAHVVINYAGVHPRSASALWARACSRIGQCSRRKQGVWAIAFASKLAPTKSAYNARRFSMGRMSSSIRRCASPQRIGPVGASLLANRPVQPQRAGRLGNRFREQARSHKNCVQRQALQRGCACRHQLRRCASHLAHRPCGSELARE